MNSSEPDSQPVVQPLDVAALNDMAFPRVDGATFDNHPVRDDLARLRARLPFLPIYPFPKNVYLEKLANNAVADIKVPDNAVLMFLSGVATFLVSINGVADGVISQPAGGTSTNPIFSANLVLNPAHPPLGWFYCRGLKAVSVKSLADNNFISGAFILADEI